MRSSDWYDSANEDIGEALCRLAWAIGRTGVNKKVLIALLDTNQRIPGFSRIRRAAALALEDGKLANADLTGLEAFLDDDDGVVRQTVAEIIAREDSARAGKQAGELLSDRSVFRRLSAHKVDTLQLAIECAEHSHYQAIVLPELVSTAEVSRLSEVASNKNLGEAARLGAVEGLARIANDDAEKQLANIGADKAIGEEIQKAAWRGLRRSKREQARAGS